MEDLKKYFASASGGEASRLRAGVNYRPDFLPNSLKTSEAQKIMALIYQFRVSNRYPLLESHPGIGSGTVVFAGEIGRVIPSLALYEDDAEQLAMLEANLRLYGFRQHDLYNRSIHIMGSFDRVPDNFMGGVGIFHPKIPFRGKLPPPKPSRPEGLTREEYLNYYQDWLNKPIFIGPATGLSITRVIDKVRNALQLSLFLLPLDFPHPPKDPNDNSIAYHVEAFDDFKILMLVSSAGQTVAQAQFGARSDSQSSRLKAILAKTRAVLTDVNTTLTELGYVPIDVDLYTSEPYHRDLEEAFTDKDANKQFNLEKKESHGDSLLKGGWATYIYKIRPDADQNLRNLLFDRYMSRNFQPTLTTELGLLQAAIYIDGTPINRLKEDLFESFVGAIGEIAFKAEGEEVGMARAYHIILHMFRKRELEMKAFQPPETQVKETLEAMWFSLEPVQFDQLGPDKVRATLFIPQSMIDFLRGEQLNLTSPIIGTVEAPNKKRALKLIWEAGLKTLKDLGLTPERMKTWAEAYKIDVSSMPLVAAQMRSRGAITLYFQPGPNIQGKRRYRLWEVVGDRAKSQSSNRRRGDLIHVDVAVDADGNALYSRRDIVESLTQAYVALPDSTK